jgi:hypothetical protein
MCRCHAAQEDPRILLALLDYAPAGAFTRLAAVDGTTPFHLAFQMGHFTLDSLAALLSRHTLLAGADSKAAEAAAAAKAAATGAGRRRQQQRGVAGGNGGGDAVAGGGGGGGAGAGAGAKSAGWGDAAAAMEVETMEMGGCGGCGCGGRSLPPRERVTAAAAAAAVTSGAAATGTAGGGGGSACGELVDPCLRCHSTLPPIMLSIAAACADCGVRVPCLGRLTGASGGAVSEKVAAALAKAAAAVTAVGHDTSHCAGCVTAAHLDHHNQQSQQRLTGRKRAAPELPAATRAAIARIAAAAGVASGGHGTRGWGADAANNCAGVADCDDGDDCDSEEEEVECGHHHGSVYSVVAMCQGCHANRVLEVM